MKLTGEQQAQLDKLKELFDSGILDKGAYDAGVKKISTEIESSNVGIAGDHGTVHGDIQIGDRTSVDSSGDVAVAKNEGSAVIVKNVLPAVFQNKNEEIGLIADNHKTGWITTLWNILSKRKKVFNQTLEEINTLVYGNPLEIAQYYIEPDCVRI